MVRGYATDHSLAHGMIEALAAARAPGVSALVRLEHQAGSPADLVDGVRSGGESEGNWTDLPVVPTGAAGTGSTAVVAAVDENLYRISSELESSRLTAWTHADRVGHLARLVIVGLTSCL